KAFDMLITAGHAQGVRHPGIYELDGDTWTLCLATQGSERPENFSTAIDSGLALETLQRNVAGISLNSTSAKTAASVSSEAPAQYNEEASGPVTELEGEWAMISAVLNGVPMDPNLVKWCKRITRGNVTKVVAGLQVFLNATYSLDQSKN